MLSNKGLRLPRKFRDPLCSGYIHEDDDTEELKADGVYWYQEIIEQIRWAVELGRYDILP